MHRQERERESRVSIASFLLNLQNCARFPWVWDRWMSSPLTQPLLHTATHTYSLFLSLSLSLSQSYSCMLIHTYANPLYNLCILFYCYAITMTVCVFYSIVLYYNYDKPPVFSHLKPVDIWTATAASMPRVTTPAVESPVCVPQVTRETDTHAHKCVTKGDVTHRPEVVFM